VNRVLEKIVYETRMDLAQRRISIPLSKMEKMASRSPKTRSFSAALKTAGVSLIAELKAKSPSAGVIRKNFDVTVGAKTYARAGARALSILTEPRFFGGKLEHLRLARKATGVPLLRKDFIVDPYQVVESRVYGADAILLIVRLLTDWELVVLSGLARDFGMDALVETHNANDMTRAKMMGALLIGINSRNLDTLAMDPKTFERLMPLVPEGSVCVAESGLKAPADVRRIAGLGMDAMLVGESLLKQKDLESAARTLVAAGKDDYVN
jgi:indole-3-glycerol phosphate synthase